MTCGGGGGGGGVRSVLWGRIVSFRKLTTGLTAPCRPAGAVPAAGVEAACERS